MTEEKRVAKHDIDDVLFFMHYNKILSGKVYVITDYRTKHKHVIQYGIECIVGGGKDIERYSREESLLYSSLEDFKDTFNV